MKTTLVVLAAGMGSRYGGLKQIEPVGPNGQAILDYSVYDALEAGFDKVVCIIKKAIDKDFRTIVGTRLEKITFHLGNGNTLCITGENVSDSNIYVQSATWQGKPLNDCKLTHSQIIEGGELHFVMGDKPKITVITDGQ